MTLLALLALAAWCFALLLTGIGTWLTLRHFDTPPPHLDAPFGLYPISILKPLKGVDPGLRENLESFFTLDYPEYELIFSVADSADPACRVVRELVSKYPHARARLLIGAVEAGLNPKVNNLIRGYESAAHDWILISDSNVRVGPGYLKRLTAHLENGVGMVTAVVTGKSALGLGGRLETMFLNTFYARGMVSLSCIGRTPVVGKCMLFRRSTAKRFGGIRALARYLAEDYMAGEAMRMLNLKVIVAADPVAQYLGSYSFRDFWSRHVRWGRIRKSQAPIPFFIEPFFGSILSGIGGSLALSRFTGLPAPAIFAAHLSAWIACDFLVSHRVSRAVDPQFPLVWLFREFSAIPLWFHIASGSSVIWRGRRFRLRAGGTLEPWVQAR